MAYSPTQKVTHRRFHYFDRRLRQDRIQHDYVITITLSRAEVRRLRRLAGNNIPAAIATLLRDVDPDRKAS